MWTNVDKGARRETDVMQDISPVVHNPQVLLLLLVRNIMR